MGLKKRMYPHELTRWRRVADGRDATWERMGTLPCRWEMVRETTTGTGGDAAAWHASIMLPARTAEAPLRYQDRVILGAVADEEPPKEALSVTTIGAEYCSRALPDHWEAEAR